MRVLNMSFLTFGEGIPDSCNLATAHIPFFHGLLQVHVDTLFLVSRMMRHVRVYCVQVIAYRALHLHEVPSCVRIHRKSESESQSNKK